MTAPAIWPAEVPVFCAVGAVRGRAMPNRLSFAPSSGAPIERPLHTSRIDKFEYRTIPLTSEELNAFKTFYDITINHGSDWFAWIHPITGAIRRVKIMGDSPPVETDVDSLHTYVSFQLLVPSATPSWASYLTTINGYMQIVDQPAWDAL